MKQITAEMKNVSSQYSLAAANAKLYGSQSDLLKAKVTELTSKMQTQATAVATNKAQSETLSQKLAKQREEQEKLAQKVDRAKQAYDQSCQATGENSEESKRLKEELDKLERQYDSSEKRISKTETAMTRQEAATTESEAALAELELQLRQVNEELARQKFDAYAEKAVKVGDACEKVGRKLTIVTGAITAIATSSVKTAASFEAQMSKVQAISQATDKDMEAMTQSARYWGENSKFSATEAAAAFEYMALAGWKTTESVAGMEGVLNLATATGMDLAKASDVVTDYLSAFGMEAKEATTIADLMTYAQGNSNMTAEQLSEAFLNCAANANAMGISIEETTGLLGPLADQGLKGHKAGTALSAIFRDLTTQMKDGSVAIGTTKVQVQDANGDYRKMADILKDVETAIKGKGTAERNAALLSTFTADSIKGLNMLLAAGSEAVYDFTDELYNCSGSAKETAEIMQDNLAGQITTLKSKIEGLSITIGNLLLPTVKKGVEWFTNLVDKFAAMDEGTQKTILKVMGFVAAIGPMLLIIGKGIKLSATLSKGLGIVAAALANTGSSATLLSGILGAITSPIGIAVAAIAALVGGLAYVAFTNDAIKKSLVEVWNTFKENLKPLLEYLTNTVLPDLQNAWNRLLQMLKPIKDFIIHALTSAWQDILIPALQWLAETVLPQITEMFQILWETVLVPLGNFIGEVLEPVFQFLADTLTMLWNMVLVPFAKFILDTFKAAWNGVYQMFNQTIIPILTTVMSVIKKLWETVLKPWLSWIANTLKPIFKTTFVTFGEVIGSLKEAFQGVIDFIVGVFTLDFEKAGEGIKKIFSGVWDGIQAVSKGAVDVIKQVLSSAWEEIKKGVEKIWNPIKDFFKNTWDAIYQTVKGWLGKIKEKISGIFNECKETVFKIWDGIKSVIQVAILTVVEIVKAAFHLITLPFRFIWENCKDTVLSIWDTIKTQIETALHAIKEVVTNIVTAIRDKILPIWEAIKTGVLVVWNTMKTHITTTFTAIKVGITIIVNAIKDILLKVWNSIKTTIENVVTTIKNKVIEIWNNVKIKTENTWTAIKEGVSKPINEAKQAVTIAIDKIKSTINNIWDNIKTKTENTWNAIKNAIKEPIDKAKKAVSDAIDAIKEKFNFKWSLPSLKLPHFSISGGFSLKPPSVPSFDVDWYKNGGIMTRPTLFGENGGKLLGGGEAGPEAILPLTEFYYKLSEILDEKFRSIQEEKVVYVTNYTYLDGEEIASSTYTKVDSELAYSKRRVR